MVTTLSGSAHPVAVEECGTAAELENQFPDNSNRRQESCLIDQNTMDLKVTAEVQVCYWENNLALPAWCVGA